MTATGGAWEPIFLGHKLQHHKPRAPGQVPHVWTRKSSEVSCQGLLGVETMPVFSNLESPGGLVKNLDNWVSPPEYLMQYLWGGAGGSAVLTSSCVLVLL